MALKILIVLLILAVPLELPGCGPFLPEAVFHQVVDPEAPAEFTRVNDEPVPDQRELHDGDRIQLGSVILRFQLRAAVNRGRDKRYGQPMANGI